MWNYTEITSVPAGTFMFVLSDSFYHYITGEHSLCFLVLTCYGIGWVRVVKAGCVATLTGYLVSIEK